MEILLKQWRERERETVLCTHTHTQLEEAFNNI